MTQAAEHIRVGTSQTVAYEPKLFEIMLDARDGLIYVRHLEVLQLVEAERYLAALATVIRQAREHVGKVRLLADLRHTPVRSQIVADRLRAGNIALYRTGDRVALLVESSLLKMQLRRNLVPEYQNIFLSETAAEMWLFAGD